MNTCSKTNFGMKLAEDLEPDSRHARYFRLALESATVSHEATLEPDGHSSVI